jgi:hypothetical protein
MVFHPEEGIMIYSDLEKKDIKAIKEMTKPSSQASRDQSNRKSVSSL